MSAERFIKTLKFLTEAVGTIASRHDPKMFKLILFKLISKTSMSGLVKLIKTVISELSTY